MNRMKCGQGRVSRAEHHLLAITTIKIKRWEHLDVGTKALLSYIYRRVPATTDKLAQELDFLLKPDNQ